MFRILPRIGWSIVFRSNVMLIILVRKELDVDKVFDMVNIDKYIEKDYCEVQINDLLIMEKREDKSICYKIITNEMEKDIFENTTNNQIRKYVNVDDWLKIVNWCEHYKRPKKDR